MRQAAVLILVLCLLWAGPALAGAQAGEAFTITFSTNEDYDTSAYATADGLVEVEEDFKLVKALGLDSCGQLQLEQLRTHAAGLPTLNGCISS